MGKRERAHQASTAESVPHANETIAEQDTGIVPGLAPAGYLPEGPADHGSGGYGEPDGVRPPNADRVLAQLRDLLGPLITALDAEPSGQPSRQVPAPRQAREPSPRRAADDLVAVCADGVISYDAEEAW